MRDASYSYTPSPTMTVFAPCGTMHNEDTRSACTHSLFTREKRLGYKPGTPNSKIPSGGAEVAIRGATLGVSGLFGSASLPGCRRDTPLPWLFTPFRISLLRIVVVLIVLSLQKRLHVSGFQRKAPHHLSGCVVKGRRNSWRSQCIRRLGTSAVSSYFRIVEQHDFDLRYVRHFQDGIGNPVTLGNSALIKLYLFEQCMADSHDRAAFDLPLQLHRVYDDAGIDRDCGLLN